MERWTLFHLSVIITLNYNFKLGRTKSFADAGTDAGDRTNDHQKQEPAPPSDVPVTRSTTSPTHTRAAAASGESPAQVRRNGNPGVHPGAVQEADPQQRVRAVESE
jgi:hypothetical protein